MGSRLKLWTEIVHLLRIPGPLPRKAVKTLLYRFKLRFLKRYKMNLFHTLGTIPEVTKMTIWLVCSEITWAKEKKGSESYYPVNLPSNLFMSDIIDHDLSRNWGRVVIFIRIYSFPKICKIWIRAGDSRQTVFRFGFPHHGCASVLEFSESGPMEFPPPECLAMDQALFLSITKSDRSLVNHGFNLFFTLLFNNWAEGFDEIVNSVLEFQMWDEYHHDRDNVKTFF